MESNDEIQALLKRFQAWYKKAFGAKLSLPRPANQRKIASAEKQLGFPLPEQMRSLYEVCSHTERFILETGYLMPLDEVCRNWKMMCELLLAGTYQGMCGDPQGPIRNGVWWHCAWIPLFHDGGGNYECLDMDPAEGGTVGQIILWDHEMGARRICASSLLERLRSHVEDCENNVWNIDDDGIWNRNE